MPSALYTDSPAIDRVATHPSIGAAAVVADQEPPAVDCLHEMEVISAADPNENDVSDFKRIRTAWLERDEVAVVDLASHRVPARTDRYGFTSARPSLAKCAQLNQSYSDACCPPNALSCRRIK